MATVEKKTYTPADLLAMPDSNNIELVNGELVEKPVSALSAFVEAKVWRKLDAYCEAHNVAVVLSSTNGIQCFPDEPRKIRKPDITVFNKERFTREEWLERFVSIAPDLAVEVISHNDKFAEITKKIEEYLAAGVLLVWVIDPVNKIAYIHRKDGSVTKLHKNDELDGEDVLRGFTSKLADLLPQSDWASLPRQ